MIKAGRTKNEQAEALSTLRKMLKPGDTVYTITRHVSASGMRRRISCFVANTKKEITCIDWYIDKAELYKRHKREEGLVVGGCGMDMHFKVVYDLSSVLFPKGFLLPVGKGGRNGDKSNSDKDGGYALQKVTL